MWGEYSSAADSVSDREMHLKTKSSKHCESAGVVTRRSEGQGASDKVPAAPRIELEADYAGWRLFLMSGHASSNNGQANQRMQSFQGGPDLVDSPHTSNCQPRDGVSPGPKNDDTTPGVLSTKSIWDMLSEQPRSQPAIDMSSVMAGVISSDDKTSAISVHHEHIYDSPLGPGSEVTFLGASQQICDRWLADASRHLDFLKKLAAATDPFRDDPGEGTDWTTFDLVKVGLLWVVSGLLLAIGIFTLSQILLASGLPGFEDPFRRYLFSFVPVAAAFALKNIGSLLGTDQNRCRFVGVVQITGVTFAIVWCWFFVSSFESGPMASADEVLEALMDESPQGNNVGGAGSALLFVGLLAEMFLAAGCWLEIERLVLCHRPASRVRNPQRVAVDDEVTRYTNRIQEVTAIESRLKARIAAIERGRAVYIQRAIDLYRLRCHGIRSAEPAELKCND